MQYRDLVVAGGLQQCDQLFGFELIGGADVEDVFVHGFVKHHRAGRRSDQRHLVLRDQRKDCFVVRRAADQHQCGDLVFLDEFFHDGDGLGDFEVVVARDDGDLLPVHTAVLIDAVDVHLGAPHQLQHG
jgi:hypothetical protein